MSNYTKSFNFRNGVQVDDDNFVVNAAGLVGIGTTKPEKLLDVRGNASITGITSLTGSVVTGIITAGTIKIDAVSGVLTATKFVGDASGLQNIVAIATDGWIANTGSLSTTAKIGIGSLSPVSPLDVLGDTKIVGFTTLSGITTSIGELFANQLSVSGVSTFVGLTSLSTLFVSSTSTFTGAIDANGCATIDNIKIGITGDNEIDTSTGNLTIDSAGGTVVIDDQVNVSGILTAKSFSGPTGTAETFTEGIVVGTGVTIESGGQANFVGFVTFNNSVEIDANLEGLYLKAKKSRQPLGKVIDDYLEFKQNIPIKYKNNKTGNMEHLTIADFYYPGSYQSYLADTPLNGNPDEKALRKALTEFKVRIVTLDIYSSIDDEFSNEAEPVVKCENMKEGAKPLSLSKCFEIINDHAWIPNNKNEALC